ncbi:MAG: prepilin-type N-terminal cleavage/methylation domain-containing protein [Candidatus Omnitrophota bacterium]
MKHGFTLIELIVVIIIVGILAALGLTQYSTTVEKSRLAEAKTRLGTMRQLAYEYYLNNGTLTGIANGDVGVVGSCTSTDFYYYYVGTTTSTSVNMLARRCTSGGKTPNVVREYVFCLFFQADSGLGTWRCRYLSPSESCFGLPPC